ncbi:hypothetical protein B0H67DRAFT_640814 [Lasiosphaeris hirsuta]|uniref:F-box domain-containing protein n=1 Tax=Lasiosphaeris hirsuta TaxID=260670 RepID=A0AA40AYB2_9PEZI|nr:hypothetical protein B0H67DRAFT_640814 [Lasiosphaeris hirsuta]
MDQELNTLESHGESQRLLTLQELERTMDPLIAARVYNQRYSYLDRLPDELLVQILVDCHKSDSVALCCLAQVSRRLRDLIVAEFPRSVPCVDGGRGYLTGGYDLAEFRKRLCRDKICADCRPFVGPVSKYLFADINCCEFRAISIGQGLHCDSCDRNHHTSCFIPSDQREGALKRRCIGRRGTVRLCDHMQISWDTIEAHVAKYWNDWNGRQAIDLQACLDNFRIECYDLSHDRRCSAEQAPTWPRARLRKNPSNLISLRLEWTPHSGCEALGIRPGPNAEQASAPALRGLFRQYQQGAGGSICPSLSGSESPEMTCFDPHKCTCVHYEMGGEGQDLRPSECHASRSWERIWSYGQPGGSASRICMSSHRSDDNTSKSVCLVTSYQRDIEISYENPLVPAAWYPGAGINTV